MKHPGGRPSKKSTIDMDQMRMLYENGWTDLQVATFFKITRTTLENWKAKDPEFINTIKDWKVAADENVERSLYQRACGYVVKEKQFFHYLGTITEKEVIKQYPPDPTSCIFWLKNRRPTTWKEQGREPEDERLKDSDLEFVGIPENGDGKNRFKNFLQ